jgi:hypothetical protein
VKIFDNFRQKLDLIREIREFCHLRHGQSDFRQPANELVQMAASEADRLKGPDPFAAGL